MEGFVYYFKYSTLAAMHYTNLKMSIFTISGAVTAQLIMANSRDFSSNTWGARQDTNFSDKIVDSRTDKGKSYCPLVGAQKLG